MQSTIINSISDVHGAPFDLMVAMGAIPGWSYIQKFGFNPTIDATSDPEDIWEGGGLYQFSANGVADIISISSSSAADTMPILVYGHTADGAVVTQVITMQGQTRVALSTPLWRVYRMENFSLTGQSIAGTIYCYSGTEETDGVPDGASVVKAQISNGNNQTQMAICTIPKGKVAFLKRGEVTFGFSGGPSAGPQQARMEFQVRTYGNVFKVKKTIPLITTGNSAHYDVRPIPDPIPALTDLKTTVAETTSAVNAASTCHFWLVDESLFSSAFLASILQPGYF